MSEAQRFELSPPQWAFWEARERYQDLEGGYRSGKTTVAILKVGDLCYAHPGMQWFVGRWTQDATDAQLKPRFLELLAHAVVDYLPEESAYLLRSKDPERPSKVYLRGLKPSEGTQPFSKIHGLTIAGAYLDQPEEVPYEYFRHLQTRMSQPGYPQMLLLTPNPPAKNHWIAREFPEDNSRLAEGYRYTKVTMRDNERALGKDYVDRVERDLRNDPAEYRRAVLGQRGVPLKGRPVYQGVFEEGVHVVAPEFNPAVPLIECWDFGHKHPAVTWLQFPPGELLIHGGVMGENLFLEDFIPYVEAVRGEWFPTVAPSMLWWTCDPAGDSPNSHGSKTGVQILHGFGIIPRIEPDANTPPKRTFAIQAMSGYLRRRHYDGKPVCRINRRFYLVNEHGDRTTDAVIVDGFSVGYVWDDDHAYQGTQYANLRRPKKDGWFEHPFNTLEYGMIAFAPPDAAEKAGIIQSADAERRARQLLRERGRDDADEVEVRKMAGLLVRSRQEQEQERADLRALRAAQRDRDPYDERHRPYPLGRAGY